MNKAFQATAKTLLRTADAITYPARVVCHDTKKAYEKARTKSRGLSEALINVGFELAVPAAFAGGALFGTMTGQSFTNRAIVFMSAVPYIWSGVAGAFAHVGDDFEAAPLFKKYVQRLNQPKHRPS